MVVTRPGSERFSSGSERSSAAPAACSMVPIAPSQTSTRSPDSSWAAGTVLAIGAGSVLADPALADTVLADAEPGDAGPLIPLLPVTLGLCFRQRVEDLE